MDPDQVGSQLILPDGSTAAGISGEDKDFDLSSLTQPDYIGDEVTASPGGEPVTEEFMAGAGFDLSVIDGVTYRLIRGRFAQELSEMPNDKLDPVSEITLNKDMTAVFLYHDNNELYDIRLESNFAFADANILTDDIGNETGLYFDFTSEAFEEVSGAFCCFNRHREQVSEAPSSLSELGTRNCGRSPPYSQVITH